MARRSRLPRRRPEGTFRLGQVRPAGPPPDLDEQRITLYLPPSVLDMAEVQAAEAGVSTVQLYCARLLREAIESAHDRIRVAGAEARQGALAGFHAIEDDPEYLAEWSAAAGPDPAPAPLDIQVIEAPAPVVSLNDPDPSAEADAMPAPPPSPAALVVLRHAAVGGESDPNGFLPTLRRGEPIPHGTARDLLDAIRALEAEYRDRTTLDRRVAYALHRLAYEGQVLVSDAWSGAAGDGPTVDALRLVQEAVDRVLSGEDIRYFAPDARPEPPR